MTTSRAQLLSWPALCLVIGLCSLSQSLSSRAQDEPSAVMVLPDVISAEEAWSMGEACYEGKEGQQRDHAKAAEWYRRAAAKGHAAAQVRLGWLYAEGQGVPQDHAEAAKWYRMAAEQGNADAQRKFGWLYANGEGVQQDDAEAVKWFRMAAEQEYADAQYDLGWLYALGRGVQQDDAEAVKWFRKAAEQGYTAAQSLLGGLYGRGQYVQQDHTEAAKWYRMEAEQGDASTQYFLGSRFAFGQYVPQDDVEATKWYRKAAEQGHAVAQDTLGWRYEKGLGVPKDYAEAAKWYRKAAEQGIASAQYNLGWRYEKGRGVLQDDAEAAKWYRMAAEKGNTDAQYNLGWLYEKGRGVPQDDAEAAKWYHMAAEKGDGNTPYNRGLGYATGQGVPQDDAEAAKWFRKAAEQGHANAQYLLGVFYEKGQGVGQDYIEAYAYLNLAAAGGSDEARKLRDEVSRLYLEGQALLLAQQRSRELQIELDAQKARIANAKQGAVEKSGNNPAPQVAEETKVMGTGFVVSKSGIVVTNWHVVEHAKRIELMTTRGRVKARVLSFDASNDLVILRSENPLPVALPITSSRGTKLGAEVFTIGFPNPDLQGFSPKYNRGEISSLAGPTDDPRFFQISVPVQPGNSGGALCDAWGRVIGIVAAKLDEQIAYKASGSLPENVNYAIKSAYLLAMLESLDLPDHDLADQGNEPLSAELARQRAQDAAVLVMAY